MKKDKAPQKSAAELRREAEAILGQAPGSSEEGRTDAELLHELQVHQIELEMQNETLRQSQIAHLGTPLRVEQDIARLDIAMHHIKRMNRRQPARNLSRYANRVSDA